VFHMNVAKVNQDVAYVAMAIRECCKSLLQMFHLFLRRMLQAFYLDVAYVVSVLSGSCICLQPFQVFSDVLLVFQMYVTSVSDVCCKCFSCFGHILQVFHLDVAKVDRVLHLLKCDPPLVASVCCSC
jgi:hypothetical protein